MIDVHRHDGRPWRIGHRGAAALAPQNTLRALEAAVAEGVDIVEFDVVALRDGTLVLAHSVNLLDVTDGAARGRVGNRTLPELRRLAPDLPTLDEALAHLAARAPRTGLHVDLKWHGYEEGVVRALREHDVVARTLVSSCFARSLHAIGRLEPRLRLGLAYPLDRFGLARNRMLAPAVLSAILGMRQALPFRIGRWLERTGATVAALHWALVSRPAIARCHARGAAVFAWTVDHPRVLRRLVDDGVDGVITNDPRIFRGTLNA